MCRSYCIPRNRDAVAASLLLPPTSSSAAAAMAIAKQHHHLEEVEETSTSSSSDGTSTTWRVDPLAVKLLKEDSRYNVDDSSSDATVSLSEAFSSFGDDNDDYVVDVDECSKDRKQVTFGYVQIRRYPIILGDHPSVPTGAPITIDWSYDELPSIEFNHFESTRITKRRSYNHMYNIKHNLILSHYCRQSLLLRLGYDLKQQRLAEKEAFKIQKQRYKTLKRCKTPGITKVEEMIQSIKRKIIKKKRTSVTTSCHLSSSTSTSCGIGCYPQDIIRVR